MDGKSDKWSGMEGKREREMAVSWGGGGGRVCCWLCSRADRDRHTPTARITDPQQETHTHTHTQACKMQTHTQTNRHARTHQEHTHTHKMVSRVCVHRHTRCVGWPWPQQMLSMNILAKLSGRVSICMDQM